MSVLRPLPATRCQSSCAHHDHQPAVASSLAPVDGGSSTPDSAPMPWWSRIRAYLRRWSGDDAYERYLAEHRQHGHALLSRREFYRRYLDHRAGGSRCC